MALALAPYGPSLRSGAPVGMTRFVPAYCLQHFSGVGARPSTVTDKSTESGLLARMRASCFARPQRARLAQRRFHVFAAHAGDVFDGNAFRTSGLALGVV